ncbi:RICIN domain-containing protein [Kribbella sp. NPDC056951]|uniref:RICIN domain-containing protein n=1 Tax=Kribbella sp. NPDC056951 TaxID=3345978 RepID=UPI003634141C
MTVRRTVRRLIQLAVVGAMAMGMATVTGVLPASAEDYAFLYVNQGSRNGCLDLGSYASGSPVFLARCNATLVSQKWIPQDNGLLRNKGAGNGCLDLTSYQNGGQAVLTPCDGRLSQQWVEEQLPGGPLVMLRSVGSGDGCLQFAAYTTGTPATLTRCADNDPHQVWEVTYLG